MNFKNEYKKAVDTIVPDEKFLANLSEKMKQEQEGQVYSRRKTYWKPLVAAACLCVVVLAGMAVGKLYWGNPDEAESMPVAIGNTAAPTNVPETDEKNKNQNLFVEEQWYQEGDSAEKILNDFVGRLQDGSQVEAVYKNVENTFTEDMTLSAVEVSTLAEQIAMGSVQEKEPEDMGKKEYYMAEFKNGDIIKFVLSDTGYFMFQDLQHIYLCKK